MTTFVFIDVGVFGVPGGTGVVQGGGEAGRLSSESRKGDSKNGGGGGGGEGGSDLVETPKSSRRATLPG